MWCFSFFYCFLLPYDFIQLYWFCARSEVASFSQQAAVSCLRSILETLSMLYETGTQKTMHGNGRRSRRHRTNESIFLFDKFHWARKKRAEKIMIVYYIARFVIYRFNFVKHCGFVHFNQHAECLSVFTAHIIHFSTQFYGFGESRGVFFCSSFPFRLPRRTLCVLFSHLARFIFSRRIFVY